MAGICAKETAVVTLVDWMSQLDNMLEKIEEHVMPSLQNINKCFEQSGQSFEKTNQEYCMKRCLDRLNEVHLKFNKILKEEEQMEGDIPIAAVSANQLANVFNPVEHAIEIKVENDDEDIEEEGRTTSKRARPSSSNDKDDDNNETGEVSNKRRSLSNGKTTPKNTRNKRKSGETNGDRNGKNGQMTLDRWVSQKKQK